MVRVYLGDGDVGAYGSGSGVPDDEVANRLNVSPRTLANGQMRPLMRIAIHMHPLGQPADDVGEGSIVLEFHPRGWMPTAEGGTLLYGNAVGGSSVHVASIPAYVILAPGDEFYGAAGAVTHVTVGGARGGGPIQTFLQSYPVGALRFDDMAMLQEPHAPRVWEDFVPAEGARGRGPIQHLLQPYYPVGALGTRAPRSSQDVARDWALVTDDALFVGNGEAPLLGGGALTVTDGGGANARNEHAIDMPPSPPDATTGTTDRDRARARKILEKLLFGFLPSCVGALGPLTGAPDGTKLAIYITMAMLIALLVIGISTRAYAAHVIRLAACAGIFAMTLFVSIQFSRGIYVAIAALVGVALSGLTLAV